MVIPLKINNKQLCEIFTPEAVSAMTDEQKIAYSIDMKMYPSEVNLTSETYSRDSERTADYELERLVIVNRKAKPEFTWSYIKYDYVAALLNFLGYTYNFKNESDVIIPVSATPINVTFTDFTGERTISAYLGQTIEGTLTVLNDEKWWMNFRIAFPEM